MVAAGGKNYTLTGEEDGEEVQYQIDAYPKGSGFLFLRLHGSPRAYKEALKDFSRARKTVKPLKNR